MSKNLRVALMVSLGAHVLAMSAVTIIVPEQAERMHPYTRVDFLGSILRKTVFDIMLENVNPLSGNAHRYGVQAVEEKYLKASSRKIELPVKEVVLSSESSKQSDVMDFLTGSKDVPDLFPISYESDLFSSNGSFVKNSQISDEIRKVVYKPDVPSFISALYGGEREFTIKLRAFVSGDGMVMKTEQITTTGYPDLDMTAAGFLKGWVFERQAGRVVNEEWVEVEVLLGSGDD